MQKFCQIVLLIFLGCVFIPCCLLSQSLKLSSAASLAEKIYLQLDNSVYTTDQTIWFKAIVTKSIDHIPTNLSGVLYVELIDPSENIVEKKLVKLQGGIGNSFFQLAKNYVAGVYMVRAYTEWSKNFGPHFFFQEYIEVFAAETSFRASPITNIKVVEGQNNKRRINVRFDPFSIDSLAGKDLLLYLTFDEKKDTLSIRRNSKMEYLLDYAVPEDCQFVTLNIETSNQASYAKTILLDNTYLDFQVFPESGEMVHGLPVLLGLKVLDHNGRGLAIDGQILNKKGQVVSSFKTNKLGMGTVVLEKVDSSEKYTARISTAADSSYQKVYDIPVVAAKGNTLSVSTAGDKILLKARSNYLVDDSMTVRASCRGAIHYDFKGRLKRGELGFAVPSNLLPEGIIYFTLMTDSTHPVAERLYFNQRPETRINVVLSTDKGSYVQREQTKLTIETKNNEGQVVPANVSVLVFDHSLQGGLTSTRQNILSYFLLSSELKGEIENPGFYFEKDANRFADLDALMLTQGWRKYKYTKDTVKVRFQPEYNLSVSGIVKGGFFTQKGKKETDLTLMTFGANPSFQTQKTDSFGRFSFPLDEEYGQSLNILIQSANKSGKQKDYTITLNKKETPQIVFNRRKSVERPDTIVQAYVENSIKRKKAEDAFKAAAEGKALETVIVKTYAMTPERKLVTDQYGKPNIIIDGKEIRDKEAKWSYGLYSVLLFNFPDKIKIVTARDGVLFARHYNREPTLVVIDGIAVKYYDYGLIASIPPSEVKSFEIIPLAKNFRSLFCEAVPDGCGLNAPSTGNVIAIYTYGKKGIYGVQPAVGIMKADVPVFATPREFYAPKHQGLKPQDWQKPDLRSLIHWEPVIGVDSFGKATAAFYNADNIGKMQIVVEAISANGEVGYQELLFEVNKKNR